MSGGSSRPKLYEPPQIMSMDKTEAAQTSQDQKLSRRTSIIAAWLNLKSETVNIKKSFKIVRLHNVNHDLLFKQLTLLVTTSYLLKCLRSKQSLKTQELQNLKKGKMDVVYRPGARR